MPVWIRIFNIARGLQANKQQECRSRLGWPGPSRQSALRWPWNTGDFHLSTPSPPSDMRRWILWPVPDVCVTVSGGTGLARATWCFMYFPL